MSVNLFDNVQGLIQAIESAWSRMRVLVVGDVMIDKYAHGHVERISPEAPVPVVRVARTSEQPGGAANVAMNLAGLGGSPVLIGFAGADDDHALLKRLLSNAGVEVELLAVPNVPTTSKLRILGGQQQIVRLDVENTSGFSEADYRALLASVERHLPSVQAVVLSDYAKGVLSPEVCAAIIVMARDRDIPVLVDPKARDFSRYRGATTICPNLAELAAAVGGAASDAEQLLVAAQAFPERFELDHLTVTMSEKGIALLWPDHSEHVPAQARQVFDVSGAGDTVIATLALCAAAKQPPSVGIRLANLAAGIVVGKVGTVPIERRELLSELKLAARAGVEDKVCSLDELRVRADAWRAAGEKIVFTNGCFDLVHVGHVTLLEDCKHKGDRLVVGLNSDASVSGLKGPARPVIKESDRARLLAALSATDAVVIFDQPTPIDLIQALRPDVLVKGGDYTPATVVGADLVAAWGGRVEIVPLVAGFSTTDLVRRAAESAAVT